ISTTRRSSRRSSNVSTEMAKAATGTTPAGTRDQRQASEWVRQMFAEIAPKYDLLNHLLSFNIDRAWRRALLKSLEPVLGRLEAHVLDLCCGTGDVLLDLEGVGRARVLDRKSTRE